MIGSVSVSPLDIIKVIFSKITGNEKILESVSYQSEVIIWMLRLPRVILGFLIGGALAISGTAVQSVLKNPLASPYTLGVSTGASLGVSIYLLVFQANSVFGMMTLPLVGFICAMVTIFSILAFSKKVDPSMNNTTLILMGMVVSLFLNSVITLMLALFRQNMDKVIFWQMGSLALRGWPFVLAILPFFIIGVVGLLRYQNTLDLMTLSDENAKSLGVEVEKVRTKILILSALLTGTAVALSGTIGFIGLVTPHVIRRMTGPNHRLVLPLSILFGGCFLVLADLLARTIISPSELPVGAITAFIGAPFFALIFFRKGK